MGTIALVRKNQKHLLVTELIARYDEMSVQEASGLIGVIAREGASLAVTDFLISIGDERDIREPAAHLRVEARKALVRYVASELLKLPDRPTDHGAEMVRKVVAFFADDAIHAQLPDRYLKILQEFLGRCVMPDASTVCEYEKVLKALVYAKHFALIVEREMLGAIPLLYAYLYTRLTSGECEPVRYAPASQWLKTGYAGLHDLREEGESRAVVADLVRINLLCGDALRGQNTRRELLGYARTLLELVALDLEYYKHSLLAIARKLEE